MKKIIYIIIISFSIILNGCIEKKTQIESPEKNYIIYNIGEYPSDLIMLNKTSNRKDDLLNLMFEGLVRMDGDGNIVPGIAESWEVSKDGIEYTFRIRENARWSDGGEISAEDFENFFSEILSKNVENDYAYQLNSIYGVKDYRTKNISFKEVAIAAADRKTLQIRLNEPSPDLLKILSQPIFSLRENMALLRDWKNRYSGIRFSGPYSIVEFKDNNKLTLNRNSNYWEREAVSDNWILITENPNAEAALADFETYKINIMKEPPLSEVKRLVEDRNTLVVYTNNIIGLAFNFEGKEILKDINFRKALYEVLDPVEIAETSLTEYNVLINSYEFSGTKNVFKDNAYKGNREMQRGKEYFKKLQENELPTLKLVGLNTDKNRRLGKVIADNVKKVLDINIQWKLYDEIELKEIISKKNFDIILSEYEQPYRSELLWLEKWSPDSKDNYGGYSNINYISLLGKIPVESNEDKRKSYIEECNKLLKEDLPVIPLFYDIDIIIKSEDVKGLKVNRNGTLDFKNVYKQINNFN